MEHRRRGFSLLEMVVVFTLMALAIGTTVISLRRTIDREGPRGLAHTVASDIRAARAEAQRSGSVVAYCIPRGSASTSPFARSAVTRKGEQRGDVYRVHGYQGDFDASLFVGNWPGASLAAIPPSTLSAEWATSLDGQFAIIFRPDGTAFSPSIPRLDGHFAIVTGHGFTQGADLMGLPTLSAATDPNLVLVSESGSVSVVENKTPTSGLTVGGEVPTEVAEIVNTALPSGSSPSITNIRYLPSRVPGLDPGVGQTYTQIHPEQREGEDLEYGLATLEIRASNPSGGPLYYELTSTPSQGLAGNFSDQNNRGRMSYTPRSDSTGWDWTAVVSWRPPPGADPETEYKFKVRVFNDDGLEDVIESGAGLLPVFRTLSSPRIALEDALGRIYLANMDGASIMELTSPDQGESRPFFSPDGTRLFTFGDSSPVSSQLIARNADGSGRRVLSNIPIGANAVDLKFDPLYAFAAYSFDSPPPKFDYWDMTPIEVLVSSGGSDGEDIFETQYKLTGPLEGSPSSSRTLKILHLNSQDELTLTVALSSEGGINWGWDGTRRFHINFQEYVTADQATVPGPLHAESVAPPFAGNNYTPSPGFKTSGYISKQLLGYPPTVIDVGAAPPQPNFQSFNNRSWSNWVLAKYDTLEAGEGTYLRLRNLTNGANETLAVTDVVSGEPCWSADGRSVIYIARNGAGNYRLVSRQLLNSDGSASIQPPVTVLTQNGITSPKLSPDGNFVYFLRSSRLWRCRVQADADDTVVRLSDKAVVNYAITR